MLSLLSLLQSRRDWSGGELAERLGVTGRTVRRDIDRLRELGYPIESRPGTAGGYRLTSGRNLPPLLLDDEEAVAVAAGLLTAAGTGVSGIEESSLRALAKLQQVLPARLRSRIAAVGDATVAVPSGGGPPVEAETLAVLAAACRDQELVTFDYRNRQGEATARRVEPHSLVTTHGRWCLVAYDPDRAAWRIFRLDRLVRPAPTHRRFTQRELPAEDAAAYLAESIAAAPYRYTARAVVGAAAGEVEAVVGEPLPGTVERRDEHTCEVRVRADSLDLVAGHLAALAVLGGHVTVDGPLELLDRLHAAGRRLAEATRR